MKTINKIKRPDKIYIIPIGDGSATLPSKPNKETISALQELVRLAKKMTKCIILLFIPALCHSQTIYNNCPLAGDNPNTASKDSLKNRYDIPATYKSMQFDEIAAMKADDTSAYPVSVEGYVILVKNGDKETCNCHSATDLDVHIELTKDSNIIDDRQSIICEINPRLQSITGYSTKGLKATILHHKVRIYGYLFSDSEHKQNSAVDDGKGLIWRETCKEIHPVCKIEISN